MERPEVKIIHENERYLILEKPAGLVVNRSITAKDVTLQDIMDPKGLLTTEDDEAVGPHGDDFYTRSGIAHRLDKDTSGLIIVAKKEEFFNYILTQFKERKVEKEYFAVVCGELSQKNIEIDAPIGRNPNDRTKMAVVAEGRPAYTFAEVLNTRDIEGNKYTLLKVLPKTGRTHQIRVHMAAINHFIAGDSIYCPRKLLNQGFKAFGRMMLHAHRIGFIDDKSHDLVYFESKLPAEYLPFI